MNDSNKKPEISGEVNLSVFADPAWYSKPEESKFWLRIYTLLGIKRDEISDKFENAVRDIHYLIPIRIRYGFIGEVEWPKWEQRLVGNDDGHPEILINQGTDKFPGSTCIFISMPFISDGKTIGPDNITYALSVIHSLLVSHLGKNTLRDIIFNGSVSAHDGQFSPLGTITNIPKPFDGPTVQDSLWVSFREIVESLEKCNDSVRERCQLSIEIFERGIEEYSKDTRKSDAFLFYWIAMEILCGGEGRIETALQNAYRFKDREEVQTKLGTSAIRGWRNGMVHDGKRPPTNHYVERFMQLMFTDILRSKLELNSIGLALSFSKSAGVDLSEIGLENLKTDEDTPFRIDFVPAAKETDSKPNKSSNLTGAKNAPSS